MTRILGFVFLVLTMHQGNASELVRALHVVLEDVDAWTLKAFEVYREEEPRRTRGPFFVDLQSLISAAREGTGVRLGRRDAAAAVGRAFRDATEKDVVRSAPSPDTSRSDNYWIVDDGIHVQIDSIGRTSTGYEVVVTYRDTERRPAHEYKPVASSGIGASQVRYSLIKRGGKWAVQSREILFTT